MMRFSTLKKIKNGQRNKQVKIEKKLGYQNLKTKNGNNTL